MGLMGAKIKVSVWLVPSGSSKGKPTPCLFHLVGAAHIPWLVVISLWPLYLLSRLFLWL